jgi:hypothetical protein
MPRQARQKEQSAVNRDPPASNENGSATQVRCIKVPRVARVLTR